MISKMEFYNAHRKLIIKSIEELHYDEIFKFERKNEFYILRCIDNVYYQFQAKVGAWGNIQINKDSFTKVKNDFEINEFTVSNFFFEVQEICQLDDQTLAKYIEEANQTIFSDIQVYKNHQSLSFENVNFQTLDQNLAGHTKIIMNKGRIGWGQSDIVDYAPEFRAQFKLIWIAVKKNLLEIGFDDTITQEDIFPQEVLTVKNEKNISDEYFLVPIHPWQWNHYIHNQFLENLVNNEIIELGPIGDFFSAQSSIRTLTNMNNDLSFDIKLSLSILNTSCVRGLSLKYVKNGYQISNLFEEIVKSDSYLRSKLMILKESCAVGLRHKDFNLIKSCSYRYKEFFGAVWRESVASKLGQQELALPCASLLIESETQSYIVYLIENSKLSAKEWMHMYFEVIILPLYHLQLFHGLGLVAHGQNIILVVENFVPKRMLIKDFHGDLRISNNSRHLGKKEFNQLDQLPAHYLIHDLLTGHFVTVLRYLSRHLEEKNRLSEDEFYNVAGDVLSQFIQSYIESNGKIDDELNLLKASFEKILINKVRFVAGYSETSERLRPLLGCELTNPMTKFHPQPLGVEHA